MSTWCDLGKDAFVLSDVACPCYCDTNGMLLLVACPKCTTVFGRCDEVDELIRDLRNPVFDPGKSIHDPHVLCPICGGVPYGQFRAATQAEIEALGFSQSQFRLWRIKVGRKQFPRNEPPGENR